MERYEIICPLVNKYTYINKINNIKFIPFYDLIKLINNEIYKIVNSMDEYYFVPIHGDCQFNNILYNVDTDDIIFIDPRGYFGKSEIFGILEYDTAKINFALTGYDEFDNRIIDNLDITDDNINIIINILDNNIILEKNICNLLMLSIWLSNSHCFINNEKKTMYSYYIARYLGTLYFT